MKNFLFTIVTPAYNCEQFIEDCILSIKNQKYPNFEHIIIDGGSTDGTIDIIKKYENTYPMRWISEKDNGMYDAIAKGFSMAKGDVYSWINADDMYMPWTLQTVNLAMNVHGVSWCKGINSYFTEQGALYFQSKKRHVLPVSKKWIAKGYCDGYITGFLQQESMFWKAELWQKSGGLNSHYRYAGDYHLWKNFAKYEKLYTINSVIAGFRKRKGQLSGDRDKYYAEIPKINLLKKIISKLKLGVIWLIIFKPAFKTIISVDKLVNDDDK